MNHEATEIVVEFFGIARSRAGVPQLSLQWSSNGTLGELWKQLRLRVPSLIGDAAASSAETVPSEFLVNLDGQRFVRVASTPIPPDSRVLIMSPDAGG